MVISFVWTTFVRDLNWETEKLVCEKENDGRKRVYVGVTGPG